MGEHRGGALVSGGGDCAPLLTLAEDSNHLSRHIVSDQ